MPTLLFVYGTLRRGLRLHHSLAGARFVEYATLSGSMYDVGTYPALVLDNAGMVRGEIWEVDDAILARLDRIEGYVPGCPDNLYERCEVVATSDSLQQHRLWLYVWNGELANMTKIVTGEMADYALWIEGREMPEPEPEDEELENGGA